MYACFPTLPASRVTPMKSIFEVVRGRARPRKGFSEVRLAFSSIAVVGAFTTFAVADAPHKILDNGKDDDRLVVAVLGDGFTKADLPLYAERVQALVLDGVLGHDLYASLQHGFNVYRVDTESNESGISTPDERKDTA